MFWKSHSVVEANPELPRWRAQVTHHARQELLRLNATDALDGPLAVVLVFRLHRPPSVHASRVWPSVTPDLDKLIRAVLDGLTDAHVWTNDSRVVSIRATKLYANRDEIPGVIVLVNEAGPLSDEGL